MDSKELKALAETYKTMYAEAESPAAEMEKKKKDDKLFGSPNKKNGKGLDPVGKEDDDVNNDGKVDSSDSYLKKRRAAIGKAMDKGKVDEGAVTTGLALGGALALPYLAKKFLKPKVDKKIEGARNNLKIGGNRRSGANLKLDHKEVEGEVIVEKQKDTPDQVAAVIDMYRSKKGTDEADKDSMEGKKKEAKKERDYAKFERDKMARDAQKSGHPFMHAKGSTTEKEGKKSVKMAPVKDSYEPSEFVQKLVESGKFSEQEIAKIIEVDENI